MSRIIKLIIIVVLVFCLNIKNNGVFAQFNFVLNPSFELLDTCPYNYNIPSFCSNWDTLKAGGGGGADVFSGCSDILGYPTPNQSESYQMPRHGVNYIEMVFFIKILVA